MPILAASVELILMERILAEDHAIRLPVDPTQFIGPGSLELHLPAAIILRLAENEARFQLAL